MSEIEKAIECLSCECGCAELDLSNGERIDEENVEKFASSCRLAIQALQEKAEREKHPSGWIPVSDGEYKVVIKDGVIAECQDLRI